MDETERSDHAATRVSSRKISALDSFKRKHKGQSTCRRPAMHTQVHTDTERHADTQVHRHAETETETGTEGRRETRTETDRHRETRRESERVRESQRESERVRGTVRDSERLRERERRRRNRQRHKRQRHRRQRHRDRFIDHVISYNEKDESDNLTHRMALIWKHVSENYPRFQMVRAILG